jgi:WD40 repeat protein
MSSDLLNGIRSGSVRLLCRALLWLLVGLSPATAQIPEDIQQLLQHRGHALLIGVADYKTGWPPLANVKNDLQELKAGLEPFFETVDIVPNPTVAELRDRMSEFLLGQWNNPGERLFIYYAGHGFTAFNQSSQDNDGYITGSDTPGKVVTKAVSFYEVDSWSRQTSARHVLMVFDSCFSGSLFQTMGPPPELPLHNNFDNVRTLLRRPMRYYITAGRQNEEVAADSTFATLLLRGLRGDADKYHEGIISAEELGIYLYHVVPNYSPRPQTPQFKSIGNAKLSEGQFYFLTALAHPALAPQLAPAPAPQAALAPQSSPPPAPQTAPALLRTLSNEVYSVNNWVYSIAYSPDGRTLASGNAAETIELWNSASGQLLRTLTGPTGDVMSVAFSPDGHSLASGSVDKTVKLWDAVTGQQLRKLTGHTNYVESVAFSPDGRTLASGDWDKTVKLWDAVTGRLQRTLTGHTSVVYSVAFSPDGRTLASGSADKTIELRDPASGKLLRALTGHTHAVRCVAFSPDGRTLASGSGDETIKLWDVASGELLRTLTGHISVVYSVAFSPDGRTLASGSQDNTIKLWDVASGQLLHTLTGHTDQVWSVAYSPDGRTLASGSLDTTIKLWNVSKVNEASK